MESIEELNSRSLERFKYLLGKIGSGSHTSRDLSRQESAEALEIMLKGKASAAQIGAFLIAHRIRRPTPEELAGMLDTYRNLGPQLSSQSGQIRPICFGMPFDGRNKMAPIYPLTTLILLSQKQPVVLQGGRRMPVKYGVTTIELFEALGLKIQGLSMKRIETEFKNNGFAFIYQPNQFPLAESLINYRDEIGKRPPLATLELLWTAHSGEHLMISGFVHPATQELALQALKRYGEADFILIKGLEGGIDIPISRKCIAIQVKSEHYEKNILNPSDNNLLGKDIRWEGLDEWKKDALEALDNKGPLKDPLIWNAGNYLWLCGKAQNISEGILQAKEAIESGKTKETLEKIYKKN